MNVDTTPCPNCGLRELRIEVRMKAKSPLTYSLAGAQTKVVATQVPWLVCDGCGMEAEGR